VAAFLKKQEEEEVAELPLWYRCIIVVIIIFSLSLSLSLSSSSLEYLSEEQKHSSLQKLFVLLSAFFSLFFVQKSLHGFFFVFFWSLLSFFFIARRGSFFSPFCALCVYTHSFRHREEIVFPHLSKEEERVLIVARLSARALFLKTGEKKEERETRTFFRRENSIFEEKFQKSNPFSSHHHHGATNATSPTERNQRVIPKPVVNAGSESDESVNRSHSKERVRLPREGRGLRGGDFKRFGREVLANERGLGRDRAGGGGRDGEEEGD
jgi:FlaA1/EpsC-like NDP-sugar epimerase